MSTPVLDHDVLTPVLVKGFALLTKEDKLSWKHSSGFYLCRVGLVEIKLVLTDGLRPTPYMEIKFLDRCAPTSLSFQGQEVVTLARVVREKLHLP